MIIWDKCTIQDVDSDNNSRSCSLTLNADNGINIGVQSDLRNLRAAQLAGSSLKITGGGATSLIFNTTDGLTVGAAAATFTVQTRFTQGLVVGETNNNKLTISSSGAINTASSIHANSGITANGGISAGTGNITASNGDIVAANGKFYTPNAVEASNATITYSLNTGSITTHDLSVTNAINAANIGYIPLKPFLWIDSNVDAISNWTKAYLVTGRATTQFRIRVNSGTRISSYYSANTVVQIFTDWGIQTDQTIDIQFTNGSTTSDWIRLSIPVNPPGGNDGVYIDLSSLVASQGTYLHATGDGHGFIIGRQDDIGSGICEWTEQPNDKRRINLWGWAMQQGYTHYYFPGYYTSPQAYPGYYGMIQNGTSANATLPTHYCGIITFSKVQHW